METIKAARSGDHRAFQRLVEQHADRVRRTVIGMLGEGPLAEDVAQEVFIRLFASLHKFRGGAQLSTYLHRVAINLSLDKIKQQKRRRRWQFSLGEYAGSGSHEIADSGKQIQRLELKDGLANALSRLTPEFRAVVTLRLIQGYSVQETANMLEIPMGTVASRLARAQKKLKEILQAEGWT